MHAFWADILSEGHAGKSQTSLLMMCSVLSATIPQRSDRDRKMYLWITSKATDLKNQVLNLLRQNLRLLVILAHWTGALQTNSN